MAHIQLKTKLPGPKSLALMEERKKYVARGPFHTTPIFARRASGAVIEDVDGNHILDFACGIGVTNLGHAPEFLTSAITQQAKELLHAGFNVTPYESYVRVAQKLAQHTPGNHAKKTLLVNSGAEAVENAIKIARHFTGRKAVICFDHAFHGRTFMAMSLTAKSKPYKAGFGPFCSDIYRTPFPESYRWPGTAGSDRNAREAQVSRECFAKFRELLDTQIPPEEVAAVILEPVQGEGGFNVAPPAFLKLLSDYCREKGILVIADEIQTGFGRTGEIFASTQLGLVPDLMTLAKGIAGGLPLGAVVGRAEIMDAPLEGGIGGTYGGNPIACASSLSVFEAFERPQTLQHAKALGEALAKRTRTWAETFLFIGDVRGLGPMLALELVKDRSSREPDKDRTKALTKYAYENGVVLLSAGTYGNVVRFLVPLILSFEQLNEGCDVIEKGLKSIS